MKILTRYVLLELTKVFLISLTALTLMMIIIGVVREAREQSLPMAQVLQLIPYILPDALRMTVPVTLLLACTSVYARMSGANEVVAAKALGISPMALLWPAFVLAFLLSLFTVWLNDMAVSWGRSGVQTVVLDAVEDIIYSMLRSTHCYSSQYFAINVKKVEGKRLLRPTLTLHSHANSPAMTISAEEAVIRSDRGTGVLKILLRNGTVDIAGKVSAQFPDTYEQEIPLTDASRAKSTSGRQLPSWLAMRVIPAEIVKQEANIELYQQEMAARAAYQMLCGDFDDLTSPEWQGRVGGLASERSHLYRLMTEPHRRWSAGFSCLCFAWIGAPIAIWLRNRDFLTSFFLCFLPILVVYYPMLASTVDGAKNGTLPPCSVWAGNVILLACGVYVLRRVVRY